MMQIGDKVKPVVELVKEEYLVLSLPENGETLAFAALRDFNLQQQDARQRYPVGTTIAAATVAQLPEPSTGTGLRQATCC